MSFCGQSSVPGCGAAALHIWESTAPIPAMSFQPTSLDFGCPVYGCDFVGNDRVVVAGGGGEGRHGIANKLAILQTRPALAVQVELELDNNQDNPTSVCYAQDNKQNSLIYVGINESSAKISEGRGNAHFRVFEHVVGQDGNDPVTDKGSLMQVGALDLMLSKDVEQYQKQTRVKGRYAVFTCKDTVYVVEGSKTSPGAGHVLYQKTSPNGEDITDISISHDARYIAYTTAKQVVLMDTKSGTVKQELTPPPQSNAEYVRAQFSGNSDALVAVLNYKTGKKGIVLCKYDRRVDGIGRTPPQTTSSSSLEKEKKKDTKGETKTTDSSAADQEKEDLVRRVQETAEQAREVVKDAVEGASEMTRSAIPVLSTSTSESSGADLKWTLCALKKSGAVRAARCMVVSKDYIFVDTPDFGVATYSNRNLAHLKTVNRLHAFAITDMTVNATQTQLVTVSAANTVSVMELPEKVMYKGGIKSLLVALLSLLVLLILAIVLERMMRKQIVDDLVENSSMLQDDAFDVMDGE